MKNTKRFVKKETPSEEKAASAPQDYDLNDPYDLDEMFPENKREEALVSNPCVDPFDTSILGSGIPNYVLDPKSLDKKFPPLATLEEIDAISQLYSKNPKLRGEVGNKSVFYEGAGIHSGFDMEQSWIQTHSGRRFNPLKPNPDAVVIQDIAHALAMQCRFSGHVSRFYSVAQHSVLVSHICDETDRLWGLLHDASEAYLVDIPRPLKRSNLFEPYRKAEAVMQEAICKRFGLPFQEPPSVKRADTILLATEARDLMSPLHPDWQQVVEPLPFKVDPWGPEQAKDMFMKRFFELIGSPTGYDHYLQYRNQL